MCPVQCVTYVSGRSMCYRWALKTETHNFTGASTECAVPVHGSFNSCRVRVWAPRLALGRAFNSHQLVVSL